MCCALWVQETTHIVMNSSEEGCKARDAIRKEICRIRKVRLDAQLGAWSERPAAVAWLLRCLGVGPR